MGIVGVSCVRGYIPMAEHYQCMQQADHPCPYTQDILNAMTEPNRERQTSGVLYSPSSLLACPRQHQLTQQRDWYLNVDNAWAMQRGQMAHAYAETLAPFPGTIGTIREQRFKSLINTRHGFQYFAGKMDAIILNHIQYTANEQFTPHNWATLYVTVIDYKSKGDIGHGPDTPEYNPRILPGHAAAQRDHQQQVNLYGWLVRNELASYLNGLSDVDRGNIAWGSGGTLPHIDEVVVEELIIEYLDFHKARRFSSVTELKAKGKRLPDRKSYEELTLDPIFVSSHEYLTGWIRRHIEQEVDAETALPPPLTGDKAQRYCGRCAVRNDCYTLGREEGYECTEQAPY